MGFIYLITCSETDKVYVGQTTETIKIRWGQHRRCANRLRKGTAKKMDDIKHSYLYNSMVKHGNSKFTITPVIEAENDKLNDLEVHYIKHYNSLVPNGYNLTSGGANFKHSAQTIELMKRKKGENINKHRNVKIHDMPKYTRIRKGAGGDVLAVNLHPLCRHKSFPVSNYESLEKTKDAVREFIKELEEKNVVYEVKRHRK